MFKENTLYEMVALEAFIADNPFYNEQIGKLFMRHGTKFYVTLASPIGDAKEIRFVKDDFCAGTGGQNRTEDDIWYNYVWLSKDEIAFFKEVKENEVKTPTNFITLTVSENNAAEAIALIRKTFL